MIEPIHTYQNISGKQQTVFPDFGNPEIVNNLATINLYECIGETLTDTGFFTLTASYALPTVYDRDIAEINDAIDTLESA